MRVLVCGGRDYDDYFNIIRVLDGINKRHPITALGHGDAPGTDRLAGRWARFRKKEWAIKEYPADWDKHGKAAGIIRNREMNHKFKPWLVVAFPGGNGTRDMVNVARKANVKVEVVPDLTLTMALEEFIKARFVTKTHGDTVHIRVDVEDLANEIGQFVAEYNVRPKETVADIKKTKKKKVI